MRAAVTELRYLIGYGAICLTGTMILGPVFTALVPPPFAWIPVWAILCIHAAWKRRMPAWAMLCLTPLGLLSLAWIYRASADPLIFSAWGTIELFVSVALVTSATGTLTLIERPSASHRIRFQGLKQA